MRITTIACAAALFASATALAGGADPYGSDAEWGEALFFDADLSANRSQSCSTCHDPGAAFTDPRGTVGGAVSLGDDGHSLGNRNAPTATYASFAPAFGRDAAGLWRGGLFLDGRAADLADQAGMPPLNPAEMGMPDRAAVVARLAENPRYAATLAAELGPKATDPDAAYAAMTRAIAAYESTPVFASFDSRYDRWLRGEVKLTDQEELGRLLFFSKQFTNCNLCHQLRTSQAAGDETFSNYSYHNIGVPANPALRTKAHSTMDLAQHPRRRSRRRWQVQGADIAQRGGDRALHAQRRVPEPRYRGAVLQPLQLAQPGVADRPRDRPALGDAGSAGQSVDEGT